VIGRPHVHLQTVGSTNDHARALAEAGAPHGTIVTAREQTAGRGRQGRTWTSPPGVLPLSLVLRDVSSELLPLTIAVAVADVCGEDAGIKWPNDIWLGNGKKVAGILVEARPPANWCVAGIGINATAAPDGAAVLGEPVTTLLPRLVAALDRSLHLTHDEVLDAWRARDALSGREIRFGSPDSGGESVGVACGVDGRGRLLVDRGGGAIDALLAGEVHLTGVS